MLDKDRDEREDPDFEEGEFRGQKVRFRARRVVVKLAPAEGDQALSDAVEGLLGTVKGARVLRGPSATGRVVLLLPPGESVLDWARRCAEDRAVAYAEPDVLDHLHVIPNDTQYPGQWAPPLIGAEAAWDLQTGNANVIIGIIDSGLSIVGSAPDHDDLSTPGRFILGTDYVDGGTPRDLRGHGTHVTGIAAALGNNGMGVAGMNWGSPVYVCRTFDAGGNGSAADLADAIEEITDYAVAHGQKAVINYSGGGGASQTKKDAAQYASDHGMLLVASTGNDNGGPVLWPAAYSTTITGVIAVGSTTSSDTVSSFSNVGPEVTVVAPGSGILATAPTYTVTMSGPPWNLPLDYGTLSGTSMAAPMVTGLAALMWSRHPSHTNQKVKQCLIDTAVKLGSGNFDNSWGYGRIDALAALKCGDFVVVSKLSFCKPSKLVLCKPSTLTPCVPSYLTICDPSKLTLCDSSKLIICDPSKLTICKPSKVTACLPTQLVVCATKSIVGPCQANSILVCPSAVDGCPSTPGGCEFDPGDVLVDPLIRLAGLEYQIGELKREMWYGEGKAAEPKVGADDWFILDDQGEIHLL